MYLLLYKADVASQEGHRAPRTLTPNLAMKFPNATHSAVLSLQPPQNRRTVTSVFQRSSFLIFFFNS